MVRYVIIICNKEEGVENRNPCTSWGQRVPQSKEDPIHTTKKIKKSQQSEERQSQWKIVMRSDSEVVRGRGGVNASSSPSLAVPLAIIKKGTLDAATQRKKRSRPIVSKQVWGSQTGVHSALSAVQDIFQKASRHARERRRAPRTLPLALQRIVHPLHGLTRAPDDRMRTHLLDRQPHRRLRAHHVPNEVRELWAILLQINL
jgi:hypothetical protein